jgi:hypothetical protein
VRGLDKTLAFARSGTPARLSRLNPLKAGTHASIRGTPPLRSRGRDLVTGGLRGKKRFAFLLFFKKKILRLKMKYRKEIVSGIVHSVSPRGIRLVDSPLPRLYLFPRPLPRVAEIIRPGAFVSFVYVSTPADVIYASEGDPEKCLFYIEKFLTIQN